MSLFSTHFSVDITASLATTPAIPYEEFCFGFFSVAAGSAVVTITWYGSHDGTTFVAMYDDDNVALTTTVAADRAYRFPVELAGCTEVKAVGNDTGTLKINLKG
jgi:hypothetical protein